MVTGYKGGRLRLSKIRNWLEYRENRAERGRTLALVATLAPEDERKQIAAEALLTLRKFGDNDNESSYDPNDVIHILETLLPYLAEDQIDEILQSARSRWDEEQSARALAVAASKLREPELAKRTRRCFALFRNPKARVRMR
jgi:hypothetical protein